MLRLADAWTWDFWLADDGRSTRKAGVPGGIWCLPCESPLGPFDVNRAVRITDESLYSGRLVSDRAGRWIMLAFRNHGPDGRFIGELTDPMPIGWAADGGALTLGVAASDSDPHPHHTALEAPEWHR